MDTPQPCPSPRSSGCCCRPYPPSYLLTPLWQAQKRACKQLDFASSILTKAVIRHLNSNWSCICTEYDGTKNIIPGYRILRGSVESFSSHTCCINARFRSDKPDNYRLRFINLQAIPCKLIFHGDLTNIPKKKTFLYMINTWIYIRMLGKGFVWKIK